MFVESFVRMVVFDGEFYLVDSGVWWRVMFRMVVFNEELHLGWLCFEDSLISDASV